MNWKLLEFGKLVSVCETRGGKAYAFVTQMMILIVAKMSLEELACSS